MSYSNTWLYRRIYLPWRRRKLLNRYLDAIHAGQKPVFIHINKTAGSSIAASLGITAGHYTLRDFEAAYLKRFKAELPLNIPVFAAVRNPYDRLVSQYAYRVATNQNQLQKRPLDFKQWVKEVFVIKNPNYRDRELMFLPQTSWIATQADRKIQLVRFEKLEETSSSLLKKYGQGPLEWKKRSTHDAYQTYYDKETQAIVEQVFASDFKTFNYEFL